MIKIYLKEKIGKPELFTGRKQDMAYLLNWISHIPRETSKSTAILSRRKTGKSALMQRLYNVLFEMNGPVLPFYFEIKEYDLWIGDFAEKFFKTFIFQYLAFKTRRTDHINEPEMGSLEEAWKIATTSEIDYVAQAIRTVESLIEAEKKDELWDLARDLPRWVAGHYDESIVQMIDEFQFINRFIFWDKDRQYRADNLAGSYLHTAEYRNAPLLVSGSWVGWLMTDLMKMVPGRFKLRQLKPIPEDEALEMVYRYSSLEDIPVTEETAYLIASLTEGNPFYISSLMRSEHLDKDLTTVEGVLDTLRFETLEFEGEIRATWLEYIDSVLPRVNDQYAKAIVLHLSKNRHRTMSRPKIKEELKLAMSDQELKDKLDALFRSDIIERPTAAYQGVQDNIFDKVFRSEYGEDIDAFLDQGLRNEYKVMLEEQQAKYRSLLGEHNRYKGLFAEFMLIQHLKLEAMQNNDLYQRMIENLPPDFKFVTYENVWGYHSPPLHPVEFQIDVFARAKAGDYSLIGEVKHRQRKFSLSEAEEFVENAQSLLQLEPIEPHLLFVFSSAGFQEDALTYFKTNGLAWSEDERWLLRQGEG